MRRLHLNSWYISSPVNLQKFSIALMVFSSVSETILHLWLRVSWGAAIQRPLATIGLYSKSQETSSWRHKRMQCSPTQSAFISCVRKVRALSSFSPPLSHFWLPTSWKGRKKSVNLKHIKWISPWDWRSSPSTFCAIPYCLNGFFKSLEIFLCLSYQNSSLEINSSEVSQMIFPAVLNRLKDIKYLHSHRIKVPYRDTIKFFPLPPHWYMLLMWDGKRAMTLAVGGKKHWIFLIKVAFLV